MLLTKNKDFSKLFIILVLTVIVTAPFFVFAVSKGDPDTSIVTCGYDGAHGPIVNGQRTFGELNGQLDKSEQCTFNDFIRVIGGIVNGTMLLISVYAAISFMYAGYAYLTSGGSSEKVSYAKGIFKKVLVGYIIILTAWLIIYTIEQAFYTDDPNARPNSNLNGGVPVNP